MGCLSLTFLSWDLKGPQEGTGHIVSGPPPFRGVVPPVLTQGPPLTAGRARSCCLLPCGWPLTLMAAGPGDSLGA